MDYCNRHERLHSGWMLVCAAVLLLLAHVITAHGDQECPSLTGEEDYRQLKQFWANSLQVENPSSPLTELARELASIKVYNPKVTDYADQSYSITVQDTSITENGRGYIVRVVISEEDEHMSPSHGGSTFHGDMRSLRTRMPCATRDYFNGTYLMCCSLVESHSTLIITHEHQQFTAYALDDRRVHEEVFTKTFTITADEEVIRHDQSTCYDVDMGDPSGYWLWNGAIRQWQWVVDGCVMLGVESERVKNCTEDDYDNSILAIGDSHLRNLWYYVITYFELNYMIQALDKLQEKDLVWRKHSYTWSTSCEDVTDDLHKLVTRMENTYKFAPDIRGKPVLFMDMGIWQMAHPTYDYITCLAEVVPLLERLKELEVKIIWQTMASNPPPEPHSNGTGEKEGSSTSNNKRLGSKLSNNVIGALNYYVCSLLKVANIDCVPNWLFTHGWRDGLICGGDSHTMCMRPGGMMDVTAPGVASTQYALRLACPLNKMDYQQAYADIDLDYTLSSQLFDINERLDSGS